MTPDEVEEYCDAIRISMYADDRQTSAQLDQGLHAIRMLEQEISRVQAQLAESQKSGQQAAEAYQSAGEELFKLDKEFEMAKASMIPERLRIAS